MNYFMAEVLEFVKENDVKFIRLAFCDIRHPDGTPSEAYHCYQKEATGS